MQHLRFIYGEDPKGEGFFWPDPNLPRKRREYFQTKRNKPVIAQAVYGCDPSAMEGTIFMEKDFAFYRPPHSIGIGKRGLPQSFLDRVEIIVQSWDTAYSSKSDADHAVCLTAALVPCDRWHTDDHEEGEEPDPHYDVYMLDEFREQMDWGDLQESVKGQNTKWHPSIVLVEQRATGTPLVQQLEVTDIPIVGGEKATRSKKSRAIIGATAGSTQGWLRQHRVLYPLGLPWVEDHLKELKAFTGEGDEVDDRVDSLTQLVNYAIEQGAQTSLLPSNTTEDSNLMNLAHPGSIPNNDANPENQLGFLLGLGQTGSERPDLHICKSCKYFLRDGSFCQLHKEPTVAIGTCDWHELKK